MNDIIQQCLALEDKYGKLPFDEALPHLQKGWWSIAKKHNTTGEKVVAQYLEFRSNKAKN
ncbi:hypothetical protein J2T13_003606 [Paenibacillus sp. DS2015]|uniref:hypothetical protein n=1 Tax=Paenibacillus sp. DS2015 TaxID=3373917 RepID=UPI003D1B5F72